MIIRYLHVKNKLKFGFQLGIVDLEHSSHELLLIDIVVLVLIDNFEKSFTQYAWHVHVLQQLEEL